MSLDPQLWEALEDHGLTQAHLAMLLQALQVQKNGSLAWHFVHGNLTQCDLRLTFASRRAEVARVCDAMLEGASVLR
jgi:hypothetical protein